KAAAIPDFLLAALLRWKTPLDTDLSNAREALRSCASAPALLPASTKARNLRISVRTAERTALLRRRAFSMVRTRFCLDLIFVISFPSCYSIVIGYLTSCAQLSTSRRGSFVD